MSASSTVPESPSSLRRAWCTTSPTVLNSRKRGRFGHAVAARTSGAARCLPAPAPGSPRRGAVPPPVRARGRCYSQPKRGRRGTRYGRSRPARPTPRPRVGSPGSHRGPRSRRPCGLPRAWRPHPRWPSRPAPRAAVRPPASRSLCRAPRGGPKRMVRSSRIGTCPRRPSTMRIRSGVPRRGCMSRRAPPHPCRSHTPSPG
jgi:hypothetical protein